MSPEELNRKSSVLVSAAHTLLTAAEELNSAEDVDFYWPTIRMQLQRIRQVMDKDPVNWSSSWVKDSVLKDDVSVMLKASSTLENAAGLDSDPDDLWRIAREVSQGLSTYVAVTHGISRKERSDD